MAPEYALWGYLTYKADVYSFGIVALEIVSGKNNMSYVPADNCYCVLDWVISSFKYLYLLNGYASPNSYVPSPVSNF